MTAQNHTAIAIDFLTLCATGQVRQAYDLYVSGHFRHHNAYYPGDRESLLRGMEQSAASEPHKSFTVQQTIASQDRVAVYSHLRLETAQMDIAVVHILRFEGGKIAEMWDVGQQIPQDSPNQLGMF